MSVYPTPRAPSSPGCWAQRQRLPSPAKPKPTGFLVSSQLGPGGRYRRSPGPAHTRERSWFGQLRQLTNICEWPEQGSLGLHCQGPRPCPESVPMGWALSALSQVKDVGLKGLSPQQVSVVTQSFSPKRAGCESERALGAVMSCQAGHTSESLCRPSGVRLNLTELHLAYL